MEKMEYLVVVDSYGDGSEDYGIRINSFRCNRKDTADAAAEWLKRIRGTDAKVFHDPPPDGPVAQIAAIDVPDEIRKLAEEHKP